MKYKFILIFIFAVQLMFAKTIAKVGDHEITDTQLREEINSLSKKNDDSYRWLKDTALKNLIDNILIKYYAENKSIYVDDNELETFFIQQVGDLPRFQTNGVFSEAKFFNFKNSTQGRKVLQAMRDELLITKSKTILEESFEISDAKLLRQYFIENTKIDLGYALIDKHDVDFEHGKLEDFGSYYRRNAFKHNKEEVIKLKIFVVFKDEFRASSEPIVNRKLTQMILSDTTMNADNTSRLRAELLEKETLKQARQKALQVSELLQANANISQEIIESSYLSKKDKLGDLPEIILKSAFELNEGDFSEPIRIDNGYLVYSVVDKRKKKIDDEYAIANSVWREYLNKKSNKQNEALKREYFENNFIEFIIPAMVITKVEISGPSLFSSISKEEYQQRIKNLLEMHSDDEFEIGKIVEDNNLTEKKKTIYLEKFDNEDIIDDMIAIRLKRDENSGFIPAGKTIYFYKALSYFPAFIPNYNKIFDQLPSFIDQLNADSLYYNEYYIEHQKDFKTADSLQIGGVIFSVQDELDQIDLAIPEAKLKGEYESRLNEFYRERSVKFDYIFTYNQELAESLSHQASGGKDPDLMNMIFGFNKEIPKQQVVAYKALPDQISTVLRDMKTGSWSEPISYDEGWLIINKQQVYNAGIIPYEEMKYKLRDEALFAVADSIAYLKTKTIFDSTRYFSHLKKYADDTQIFKTSFQDSKLDYEILGDISDFRTELLRMWKNEKYSGIIRLENAYAVIFLTDINRSKQLDFEESLPKIIEILNSDDSFKLAKSKVTKIRNEIAAGEDPNSLLYYLGGWNVISDLSLTSTIPGVDFSEAIFNDVLKHEQGYCSQVIPVSKEKLLFYKLIKLNKPSKNDFYYEKDYYEKKLLDDEYEKWRNKYKAKIGVKIY